MATKPFLIRNMPEDLHHDLKVLATLQRTTMYELIMRVLGDYVRREKAEAGPSEWKR